MLESLVHLIDTDVGDNYASHEGGGLFVVDNSNMIVEQQSSVFGNIAGEAGGGVYLLRCTGDVSDSTITGNVTEFRGGGIQRWERCHTEHQLLRHPDQHHEFLQSRRLRRRRILQRLWTSQRTSGDNY